MNCEKVMAKVLKILEAKSGDFYDVSAECQEEWDQNYASIEFDLIEEEYRDYDGIRDMIITKIKNLVGENNVILSFAPILKNKKNGYYLCFYNNPLGLEVKLYNHRMPENNGILPRQRS